MAIIQRGTDIMGTFTTWSNTYDFNCLSDEDLELAIIAILCYYVNQCADCDTSDVTYLYEGDVEPACLNWRQFLMAIAAVLCIFGNAYFSCAGGCTNIRERVNKLRCLTEDQRRLGLLALIFAFLQEVYDHRALV